MQINLPYTQVVTHKHAFLCGYIWNIYMRYPLLHRKKCRTTESSRDRASQKNSCGKQGPTATEVTHRANTFSLCLLLVCYHQLFLVFVFLIRQLFLTQKDVSHGSHRTRTHCLALLMSFTFPPAHPHSTLFCQLLRTGALCLGKGWKSGLPIVGGN